MIKKIRALFTRRDKQLLIFLLIFSIFIAVIETAGVSAIMPFIAIASDFSVIDSNEYYAKFYNMFSFDSHIDFVLSFGVVLIVFYIFRGMINLLYAYMLARFSDTRNHLISYRLFENYLNMKYRDFIESNSAYINKAITQDAANISLMVSSVLFIASEVFVVVFIYLAMIYVNYKITLLLTLILIISAFFLVKIISPILKKASSDRSFYQGSFFEIISSVIGNYKIIKLKSNTNDLLQDFSDASYKYAKVMTYAKTIQAFPRLFLETVGFSLVAFIVLYLVFKYQHDISSTLSMISMFVLGLYRLLPSVNRIMSSYNTILFAKASLDIIHDELSHENENLLEDKVSLNKKIVLNNIYFEYIENKPILRNISLSIEKGSSIALIGESGSGKSTLVDIIIGLYKPMNGNIVVDDTELTYANIKSWRKSIGYIPQSVYLFDGSVAQNVCFGDSFDEARIKQVLKKANILDFLENSQDGIDTLVGDGGIKLSGGQKQRIAIARALYVNPEILVLDEATSALDSDTESKIMREIYDISKDKTLIIIAHRLSTIQNCDRVYEIKDGSIYLK